MLIYNVTLKVDHRIHEPWLQWMQTEHIPDVMKTGCFEKYQVLRLLDIDDTEGPTYAVQYYAISNAQYNRYLELHAPRLRKEVVQKWGEQLIAFRTLMEVVD